MFKKMLGMLGGGSFEVEGNPFDIKQERKAARRSCEIEVEGWAGRVHYQGVVVNLSASGLCIKLNEPIKVKSKGTVSVTIMDDTLSAERTVDCLTRWCRFRQSDQQQFLGLEYKDMKSMGKSWVKAKMQDLGFRPYNLKEQRKELRANCFLKGTVSIGGDSVPCFIKNIGPGGIFIELKKPLRAGANINVRVLENDHIPSGTYACTVRHQQHPDPSAPFGQGLAFDDLAPEQLTAIQEFVKETLESSWEKDGEPELSDTITKEVSEERDDLADIEIPDLESIMKETEPEDDEDGDAEETEGEESSES